MGNPDQFRLDARAKYVLPAHERKQKRFSINAGNAVRGLRLACRAPAVCSALKTRQFLESNDLRLFGASGPKSRQSTTVTYTHEFVEGDHSSSHHNDSWNKPQWIFKDVFAEHGGGEAYLRAERRTF